MSGLFGALTPGKQQKAEAFYEEGVNKFSDLTNEEFEKKYLMASDIFDPKAPSQTNIPEKVIEKTKDTEEMVILEKPVPAGYFDGVEIGVSILRGLFKFVTSWFGYSEDNNQSSQSQPVAQPEVKEVAKKVPSFLQGVPTVVNWKKRGMVQPVQNQNMCDSCYAFASLEAITSRYKLRTNQTLELSVQEIVDCSTENRGCRGGLPSSVLSYVVKNNVAFSQFYPFVGEQKQCRRGTYYEQSMKYFDRLRSYSLVKNNVINLIKEVALGPVIVAHQVTTQLKRYKSGIYNGDGCDTPAKVNHAALVVGYDLEVEVPYFLLKNAWGEEWGEKGYYKIAIG